MTSLRAGRPGFDSRTPRSKAYPGAHPESNPMVTRRALSLGVKRTEREADHSLSSSSEVKNAWSYTSTPKYSHYVVLS